MSVENLAPLNTSASIDQRFISAYYQYCGFRMCQRITGALVSQYRPFDEKTKSFVRQMSKRLDVNIIFLEHQYGDEKLTDKISYEIFRNGNTISVIKNGAWRDIAKELRSYQVEHETKLITPGCSNHYKRQWRSQAFHQGHGVKDCSVSNMLWSIPGVKHTKVDIMAWCEKCYQVELSVEVRNIKEGQSVDFAKSTKIIRSVSEELDSFSVVAYSQGAIDSLQTMGWEPRTGKPYRNITTMQTNELYREISQIHQIHLREKH